MLTSYLAFLDSQSAQCNLLQMQATLKLVVTIVVPTEGCI